jgi:hypothetical protein
LTDYNITFVAYPNSSRSYSSGINASGQIVGSYSDGTGSHGFVDTNGSFTTIDPAGSTSTSVTGINASGQIVGSYSDGTRLHGFVDTNGSFTTIDPAGSTSTSVTGINASGQIVGSYFEASGLYHGFVDTNGTFTIVRASVYTTVSGINDAGQLVGAASSSVHTQTSAFTASNSPPHLNEVFRFNDTNTGDHFYTTSVAEKDSILANLPNYHYEGAQWSTPDQGAGTLDVFRFFDTDHGSHFFTTSTAERDSIIKNLSAYHYEGVAFEAYADAGTAGGLTLERFYNTQTGLHHFSASASETFGINHGAAGANWVDEGAGSMSMFL